MGESVGADDGLVRLHHHAGNVTDQAAALENLLRPDLGIRTVKVCACAQAHDDLLQRGVPGPLADAVDRAFDLASAFHNCRQGIPDRHAEIVMAMHRNNRLLDIWYILANAANQHPEFLRRRVSDGVWDIDGGGTGRNDGLQHLIQILWIGAGGVHRGEFHVFDVPSGPLYHFDRPFPRLVAREPELMPEMDIRRWDEGVYTNCWR